ncbi:hypothetical protein KSU1_B0706 [Candidatus Jettenia caeni]|uniref:Uncharacterized protein n=1 Tax=Candidatus Jettenia caeni TaxID=247490 RepID=I3IIL8_9BACT|nr:hypothetical protein KSU1_B0706 [Candidatus Jettenia caeni]
MRDCINRWSIGHQKRCIFSKNKPKKKKVKRRKFRVKNENNIRENGRDNNQQKYFH